MLLLALFGAVIIGLVAGLSWCGFVVLGDRRQLSVLIEQFNIEHRMSQATNAAIAHMRQIALDYLRSGDA